MWRLEFLISVKRLVLAVCLVNFCHAQDSSIQIQVAGQHKNFKPEFLNSGFIDIVTSGQVNASARLIRIFLGEPGKFTIPLSIYSGVSSGNFSGQTTNAGPRNNDQLLTGFINPLSGIINASFEGKLFESSFITDAGILYNTGIRLMTGYKTGPPQDPLTGKPINFFNSYGTGGFYFQTGAWDKNDDRNLGIFWLAFRYIGTYSSQASLQAIAPDILSGFYHGWSLGGGIEINNLVNVKLLYYKYVKKPELGELFPICQFSFHYALRN